MKRLKVLILSIVLVSISIISPGLKVGAKKIAGEDENINVIVDGKYLLTEREEAIIRKGKAYAPAGDMGRAFGYRLENLNDGSISLIKDGEAIIIHPGKSKVILNGSEYDLRDQTFFKNGQVFLPIRRFANGLGRNVEWNPNSRSVIIGEFYAREYLKDTFVYHNKKSGYTINFPNSWKKDALLEDWGDKLIIYDRKTYDRFISEGEKNFGGVVEIRVNKDPEISVISSEKDRLLSYEKDRTIETCFIMDFQYYPETMDSYMKIADEAEKSLGSFRLNDGLIMVDREESREELEILSKILEDYVPKGIFNIDNSWTLKDEESGNTLLYLRNTKDGEASIKIELAFDGKGNIQHYRFKNYAYEINPEDLRELSKEEGLEIANRFMKEFIGEDVELKHIADLYPSLYEEGIHETYGDGQGKYTMVIYLENGFIEYFSVNK